ncbi:MAG: hypothetical protein LBS69_10760 [Prevotellaceae bacterium]|jgi:membrane-associated phospholipid phosphatase|nr:hypothetical protein [Prevotellaceae bacterium]
MQTVKKRLYNSLTKRITLIKRPDSSDLYSFPSGHTATAFAGAHILYKKYKDVSPWFAYTFLQMMTEQKYLYCLLRALCYVLQTIRHFYQYKIYLSKSEL